VTIDCIASMAAADIEFYRKSTIAATEQGKSI
jgi:hypothetical protein